LKQRSRAGRMLPGRWKKFAGFAGLLCGLLAGPGGLVQAGAVEEATLRVAAVGDTGIGERAFHPGFLAVAKAIQAERPDVLLHLGDFVYQPDLFPENCPARYLDEIRRALVAPFRYRIFVPGDNDLPPEPRKPKASGCWAGIAPLMTPADPPAAPGEGEGTWEIGPALFAVVGSFPYRDPTPWLAGRIRQARSLGLWVVLLLHEPPLTTAWFIDKREEALKDLNALEPDLILSGNQHSYERFHPLGVPGPGGELPVTPSPRSIYNRGDGVVHVVSGGGGATFKPFADQQGKQKQTAPPEVFKALHTRALMNHFVLLEINRETLLATTYRVCAGEAAESKDNPRWRPAMPVWEKITLECSGKPKGAEVFDRFEIHNRPEKLSEEK